MRPPYPSRPGREPWLGVLFFVLLGGLLLALDPGRLIGWVSLAAGALSGLTLWAVRQGWIGPDDAGVSHLDGTSSPDDELFPFAEGHRGVVAERVIRHCNGVEQWSDYLVEQVHDLARLAGGTVPVVVHHVQQESLDAPARGIRTQLDLSVAGEPLTLDYLGVAKYLSTVLHVHVARALRRAGAPYRLAWLQDDHIIVAGLPDTTDLDALNADQGLPPGDPLGRGGWTWVDECEPVALGEDDGEE